MSTNPASGSTSTVETNAGTAAATSADAPTKRRPGRPRMKDSLPADSNDNSRRSRMRLAQRSYRSRKENELATTRARADALQRALNSSLDEFIRFHELSSGKEKDLPSDFVLQLNRTAMNIMAIARSAQADHWPALDHADRLLAASTGDDNYASSYHAIPVDAGLALQATDLNDANRLNPVRMVRGHPLFVEPAASVGPVPPTAAAAPQLPHHHHHQQQGLSHMSMQQQQQQPSLDNIALNPDYTIFGQQRDVQVIPSGLRMFTPTAWSIDDSANIIPIDMAMRSNQPNNASGGSSSSYHSSNNPDHINIMVNLDNLIVKLASKAVCLGPCPGIRRGHVDEAIRDSVVQMPPM